jgi:hypothetical protein
MDAARFENVMMVVFGRSQWRQDLDFRRTARDVRTTAPQVALP